MKTPEEIKKFLELLQEEFYNDEHSLDMLMYIGGVKDGLYWLIGLYEHMDDILGGKIHVKSSSAINKMSDKQCQENIIG